MKQALVVGGTGLVGKELVNLLLENQDYEKVITISRRQISLDHEKLEQYVMDLSQLETVQHLFSVDTVFCTLGTTMKKAKSKQQFIKVDFDYPLHVAKLAKSMGVKQFFLVTAMGANQHSPFFYNQVKGNIESAVRCLQFPTFYIIRPSLLLGKRNEARLGEDVAQKVTRKLPYLFQGVLEKYKPNEGRDVAKAMYFLSLKQVIGTFVIESKDIEQIKGLF